MRQFRPTAIIDRSRDQDFMREALALALYDDWLWAFEANQHTGDSIIYRTIHVTQSLYDDSSSS